MGTLKEAVEVYNKEARLLGKPTQEIPAGYVAPEPDVTPHRDSSPEAYFQSQRSERQVHHRPWIFRHQSFINFRAVQRDDYGKPDRLYLGTVDTLREAVELYNKEAKKRGKPIQPLFDDKLDVPELNKQSTVVPGLKGINMMTPDGKFMAQVYQTEKPFMLVTTTLLMRR